MKVCRQDEQLLERLTEEVYRRLQNRRLKVKLIGQAPPVHLDMEFVLKGQYDILLLGILSPGELLSMPNDPVCCALLDGLPVYLWKEQPYQLAKHAGALRRELAAIQDRLIRLGVRPIGTTNGWMTADTSRSTAELGIRFGPDIRMTPLARGILEE